jgi:ABC-2 type transport system permease protein
LLAILRGELFKLTHRMMTRVLLLVVLVAPVAAYVLLGSVTESGDTSTLDDLRLAAVHDNGRLIVYQLCVVTTVILAASSIASEFGWGTVRTLLPRTAGRVPFLTAKLLAVGLFLAVAVVLGFLGAIVGSVIVTALQDLDGSLGGDFVGQLLTSALETAFVVSPYAMMAFVVALWSRSSAAGIAVPIVVFYAEVLLTPALLPSTL